MKKKNYTEQGHRQDDYSGLNEKSLMGHEIWKLKIMNPIRGCFRKVNAVGKGGGIGESIMMKTNIFGIYTSTF